MELHYRDRCCHFRSPGLFRFIGLLRQAYPDWLDLAAVHQALPGIAPRQLARFVDSLEAEGLPLLHYETKTRGPYRLAVAPDTLRIGTVPPPSRPSTATPLPSPAVPGALETCCREAWITWLLALIRATLALNDGHLADPDGVLDCLAEAALAARQLPAWADSIVIVRRANALERLSRYREASACLRRADTLRRYGYPHPGVSQRILLIRAKIRYNQGRFTEAETCLAAARGHAMAEGPGWLNMRALLSGRRIPDAAPEDAPLLLAASLSDLLEAIGHIFLWNGDSSLLDALCFNFGNNLLRGIRHGVLARDCADLAMQWLAANQLLCRKLGIGDDSILINLLLVDVGLDHGYSIEHWPPLLQGQLNHAGDLVQLLADSLRQARKSGNRMEIAECLRRQMRLSSDLAVAEQACREAVELFRELGRPDELTKLADEWSQYNKAKQ